ncbi:MAG TPA: hypothetical protein DHW61_06790 [Lachnoclostridium phytofermentans]|uniref:ATPase n=1 Tax=Lachnoclostridium phytofermentans TaxID=66219 RepID=A0A3D2X665_9FIRM|nr:V-type ATP synthase subunit E [Lachnoclostridium sp.]HCL02113.1 hypothetical protein [Lachnoclostridium phytofermentans]
MNIKEKAEHFYNMAVDNATAQNTAMVEDYRLLLEKELEQHKKDVRRKADNYLKEEMERLVREKNTALALKTLEIRHLFKDRSTVITEDLFSKVKISLFEFMKTKEYVELLKKQIKEAKDFAKDHSVTVYLNSTDADKAAMLREESNITIEISTTDFWGGTRAVIPDKNVVINESFLSKWEEAKESFALKGGSFHE